LAKISVVEEEEVKRREVTYAHGSIDTTGKEIDVGVERSFDEVFIFESCVSEN